MRLFKRLQGLAGCSLCPSAGHKYYQGITRYHSCVYVCRFTRLEMVTPTDYVGNLMELANNRRGEFVEMKYLTGQAQ